MSDDISPEEYYKGILATRDALSAQSCKHGGCAVTPGWLCDSCDFHDHFDWERKDTIDYTIYKGSKTVEMTFPPTPSLTRHELSDLISQLESIRDEMNLPITILDVALHRGAKEGEDGSINGGEFDRLDLPLFAGCQHCCASLAAYNSFPTRNGYISCRDCVGDQGFVCCADFDEFEKSMEGYEEGDNDDYSLDSQECDDNPGE